MSLSNNYIFLRVFDVFLLLKMYLFKHLNVLLYIWSILTKRRQLVLSGGLHQMNATITSFEGLVG